MREGGCEYAWRDTRGARSTSLFYLLFCTVTPSQVVASCLRNPCAACEQCRVQLARRLWRGGVWTGVCAYRRASCCMELDIDLSSLGLPSRKESSLGALKKRAEAAAVPAVPARPFGLASPVVAARPPPVPLAGLDRLAELGRPTAAPARATAHGPGTASGGDLLGPFEALHSPPPAVPARHPRRVCRPACARGTNPRIVAPLGNPSAPRANLSRRALRRTPARPHQTPAPSTAARHTVAEEEEDEVDFFSGSRHHARTPSYPPPQLPDELDDFFSGGGGGGGGGGRAGSPVPPARARWEEGAPHPQAGLPESCEDFFSGGAYAVAAAAAAEELARSAPQSTSGQSFFSARPSQQDAHAQQPAGDLLSSQQHQPPPLTSRASLSRRHSEGAGATHSAQARTPAASSQQQPAAAAAFAPRETATDAALAHQEDAFDIFAGSRSSAAAAAAPAAAAPAFHHLDDLASVGGGGGSSDALHDALFSAAPKGPAPRPSGPVAASSASRAPAAPQPSLVSDAAVAAALASGLWDAQDAEEGAAVDPDEPEERRAARRRRHQETRARCEAALREKLERDAQGAAAAEERHRVNDSLGPKLDAWVKKGQGNIRLYLATVGDVLWEGHTWKAIGLTELVSPVQVKKAWMRVLVNIHPDKVQQRGGTTAQRFVADKVFHVMLDSYNAFAAKELA